MTVSNTVVPIACVLTVLLVLRRVPGSRLEGLSVPWTVLLAFLSATVGVAIRSCNQQAAERERAAALEGVAAQRRHAEECLTLADELRGRIALTDVDRRRLADCRSIAGLDDRGRGR